MANRITFTIDTDAPYSAEEKDVLLNNLVDFFKDEDPDAIDGTEEISIVDVELVDDDISEEKKQAIAVAFLSDATITAKLNVGVDGISFETTLS